VLDNLREGVLVPDIYDATLNPLYRDMLAHYGAVALPCRIQHPDRKGKVESAVGHAKKTPLKGQRFESLEQAQAYLDRWEANWADTRIHGTTKRQVATMFAEEKPNLLPLPVEPFRYYQYGERVVHLDGCVEVEAAYYGLPPGWIGRGVKVQWDELCVRILDPKTGLLLREHVRQKRGWYRIQPEDHPQRPPFRVLQLLGRAGRVGGYVGILWNLIYSQLGEVGVRRILGVLSLAKWRTLNERVDFRDVSHEPPPDSRDPYGSTQTKNAGIGSITVCHSSRSRLLTSNFIPCAAASSTLKSGHLLARLRERWFLPEG
jgi:hypothetical protein